MRDQTTDQQAAQTSPYLIPVRRSAVPGYGMQGLCPQCHAWVNIWPHNHPHRAGYLGQHATEKGGFCSGSATAITYEAAVARDNRFNPQEQAVSNLTRRHLTSCRGPLIDEQCTAPICHQRVAKGLVWTLSGWKPATGLALF